jgi:hypothetical protein
MDISQIRLANLRILAKRAGGRPQLALKLEMAYAQLNHMIGKNPTRNVGTATARRAETVFNLPNGWLDQIHTDQTDLIAHHLEGIGVAIPFTKLTDEESNKRIWLNVYDIQFCCGEGNSIEFHYEVIKKKELPFEPSFFAKRGVKPEDVILAYANNDSNEPYICDGDLFGMDISDTSVKDGEMYAIYFGEQAMLKKIFIEDSKDGSKTLRLHSINPKYPDKLVNEANGSDFKIIGRQFYRSG